MIFEQSKLTLSANSSKEIRQSWAGRAWTYALWEASTEIQANEDYFTKATKKVAQLPMAQFNLPNVVVIVCLDRPCGVRPPHLAAPHPHPLQAADEPALGPAPESRAEVDKADKGSGGAEGGPSRALHHHGPRPPARPHQVLVRQLPAALHNQRLPAGHRGCDPVRVRGRDRGRGWDRGQGWDRGRGWDRSWGWDRGRGWDRGWGHTHTSQVDEGFKKWQQSRSSHLLFRLLNR